MRRDAKINHTQIPSSENSPNGEFSDRGSGVSPGARIRAVRSFALRNLYDGKGSHSDHSHELTCIKKDVLYFWLQSVPRTQTP